MPPDCIVTLVHGIGNQKKDWSQGFRNALTVELEADATRVDLLDAHWAPLSALKEAARRTLAPGRLGATDIGLEDETYRRTVVEFSRMLAADAGAPVNAAAFGPTDIFGTIKDRLAEGLDLVADVGNYVARNGVRTAVQNVVHSRLGEAALAHPNVPMVLITHSQGTVISYDVLRQAGANYPLLQTWITMGSPLRKYFAYPLEWGRQQLGVPPGLRWVNFYDQGDIVGKDLSGAVDWSSPQPDDRIVDNARNAGNAHDHWNNPEVVKIAAAEIRRLLE